MRHLRFRAPRQELAAVAALAMTGSLLQACDQDSKTPASDPPDSTGADTPVEAVWAGPRAAWSKMVRWGSGPATFGHRARGVDQVAEGPTSLAVSADGVVLVLDRLQERVAEVSESGLRTAGAFPADVEDVAVDANGTLAGFSPLRARVWLHDRNGDAGEVVVPRTLQRLAHIGLDGSRQVLVTNGFQETFSLGSEHARPSEADVLRSKREGAYFTNEGFGVAAKMTDDVAELLLVQPHAMDDAERGDRISKRIEVARGVSAIRIIGIGDGVACSKLEKVTSTPEITVERELACVSLTTGDSIWREALPPPGDYVPRRELAMNGRYVAFMHPTDQGLSITTWNLGSRAGQNEVTR